MTERWLPSDEWAQLQPVFVANGGTMPLPENGKIRVIEDGGHVVAFIVVQYVRHAEPIWIAEDYQGRGLWRSLCAAVDADAPGYYLFAPDERSEHMASELGLEKLPWSVFAPKGVHSCHS